MLYLAGNLLTNDRAQCLGGKPMTCPSRMRVLFPEFFTKFSKNVKVVIVINSLTFWNPLKSHNPINIEIMIALNFDLFIRIVLALGEDGLIQCMDKRFVSISREKTTIRNMLLSFPINLGHFHWLSKYHYKHSCELFVVETCQFPHHFCFSHV